MIARADAGSVVGGGARPRAWWATGLRVLRNAAIAVAVMALAPVGLVTLHGDQLARLVFGDHANVQSKTLIAERVRSFRLPVDPAITPLQAGQALHAIQPVRVRVPGFETIPTTRPIVPWKVLVLAPDMFSTARPDLYAGPSSRRILEASVRGFEARELEYLRALATAPVWRDFELVARAPAVDAIGGQLRIPFGSEATPETRPLASFAASRELAYAAVARASYYLAIGEPAKAETVLRSIVSYGFTFIDSGTSLLEQLIGNVIVGIGRDALQRFYVIRHDPRASLPALASPARTADGVASRGARPSADELRRRLLARIDNPALPRGERFEGMQSLSLSSCTNVRELLVGPRADVRQALDRARTSLARYPSERALVDLQSRFLASPPPSPPSTNPFQSVAVSSASVAGFVLQNPRLATCTRLIVGSW